MEERWAELLERLERGEREVQAMRRQAWVARWLAISALAGSVTFLLTRPAATQAQFDAFIRATGTRIRGPLTVVDEKGKPILQIGNNAVGRGLVLFDASGKMLCGIGRTSQGRGLAIYDDQQRLVAALGEGNSPDGVATGRGLTLLDPDQKVIAGLGLGMNGSSTGRGLTVNDATGTPVAGLGVWRQRPDRGQLILTDRQNTPLFAQPSLP